MTTSIIIVIAFIAACCLLTLGAVALDRWRNP